MRLEPPGQCGLIPVSEATLSRRPGASSILQFERVETAMHYFKKNIGDYAKKTGRLSMLQHGSYTLLIDACYDREQFPTLEQALEWTWASSKEEIEAVEFVLKRFFTLIDGVYVQSRIKQEIAEYHEKAETNKRIANERETKRKENSTKRAPVVNEAPPNQEPLTNNHKPSSLCEESARTNPGEVCKAMKSAGLQSVSPSHPKLIALIAAGITLPEFTDAAKHAFENQKPFAYALATAEGRRRDSAVAPLPKSGLNKQEALEASNRAVAERFLKGLDNAAA